MTFSAVALKKIMIEAKIRVMVIVENIVKVKLSVRFKISIMIMRKSNLTLHLMKS
jgi:hypothetical protein